MSSPLYGIKEDATVPGFRDLAAAQIMAAMMGTDTKTRMFSHQAIEEIAQVAVEAADALEAALEK